MITIEIPQKRKHFYIPENLSECNEKQYADLCKLIWMTKEKEIRYQDMRALAVYPLMGLKQSKKETPEMMENVYRISCYLDDFFNKDEDGMFSDIKLDYTKNHLRSYRMFHKYYGPEDGFNDVTFGQYLDGLEEYIYYTNTGDLMALRIMFSIFYLRKNEKYSYKNAKKKAKGVFRFVDIRHLYGFYLFFSSMQTYVLGGEISVMGNDVDLTIVYQSDEKFASQIPGTGMRSVLSELAESQVFGPYKGVEETNMWRVLVRLYELKKKELDEKERNKNNETSRA
jgi:hypothetical protein